SGTCRPALPRSLGVGLELLLAVGLELALRLRPELGLLRLAVGPRPLRGVRALARLLELARVGLRRLSRLRGSWLTVAGLARLNRPTLLALAGLLLLRILAPARVAPPVRHRVVLLDVVLSDPTAGPWVLL